MLSLTSDVLGRLPLRPESYAEWHEPSDVRELFREAFDMPTVMYKPDGTREVSNSRETVDFLYEQWIHGSRKHMGSFIQGAADTIDIREPETELPALVAKLEFNTSLGTALKYLLTWSGTANFVLSSERYFSAAHIEEATDDLQCSGRLAAACYYKQAIQVLRSVLEELLLPIHFCDSPDDFDRWKADVFQTPNLRGPKGLLARMRASGRLPAGVTEEVSDIYGELNAYIHGAQRTFLNSGHYSGNRTRHEFSEDLLNVWSTFLCRVITAGLRLLQINLDQWRLIRPSVALLCPTCHNWDAVKFSSSIFKFSGREFTEYKCQICGNALMLDPDGVRMYRVTIGDSMYVTGP